MHLVGVDLYQSAWAAITNYQRHGSLITRNVFSHSSGGWMSEIRVWHYHFVMKAFLAGR
jgi:hypothetical protein